MSRKDLDSHGTHGNKKYPDSKETTEIPIEQKERSEHERSDTDLVTQIAQLKEQVLRKAAEFENYKKRTEETIASLAKTANEGLILELLSVIDDFDRSLKAGKEHADLESFYEGVFLVRNKLMKILEGRGLKPIESVGKPFDIEYHHAMMQVPRDDVAPDMVVEELEKGYLINDKVLRHAKVIVSKQPEDEIQKPDDATPVETSQ